MIEFTRRETMAKDTIDSLSDKSIIESSRIIYNIVRESMTPNKKGISLHELKIDMLHYCDLKSYNNDNKAYFVELKEYIRKNY